MGGNLYMRRQPRLYYTHRFLRTRANYGGKRRRRKSSKDTRGTRRKRSYKTRHPSTAYSFSRLPEKGEQRTVVADTSPPFSTFPSLFWWFASLYSTQDCV